MMLGKLRKLYKLPKVCLRKVGKKIESHIVERARNSTTYKPRYINIYNRIYEDYWNPMYRARRFHLFNDIRVRLIYGCLTSDFRVNIAKPRNEFKNLKLLVVGCGGGISTEALAELNLDVTGIDPNPGFMVIAKDHQNRNKLLSNKKLTYFQSSLEEFSRDYPYQFDGIVLSEILEYIPFTDKQAFIEKCVKLCKPDGHIFITHINRTFKSMFWSFIFDTAPNFNAIPLRWFNGVSPETMTNILNKCGCCVRRIQGISFNPREQVFYHDSQLHRWYFMYATKENEKT